MRKLNALLLAISFGVASGWLAAAVPGATGTTLNGNDVSAPLSPGRHILLLSFSRGAGSQSRPWLEELQAVNNELPAFTVVVLDGIPGFIRRMVVRGIRSDVPEALFDQFVVVQKGADAWRQLVPDADDDLLQVLVVDSDASAVNGVCYRRQGPVTAAAVVELLAATCDDPAR